MRAPVIMVLAAATLLHSGCRRQASPTVAPRSGFSRAAGEASAASGAGGHRWARARAPAPVPHDSVQAISRSPSAAGTAGMNGTAAADGTKAAADVPSPAEHENNAPFPGQVVSGTVTVKIVVEPPKRAHVFWGVKDLGLAPLEIQRPRGSGPLDLVLRAPGYLTVHTRAFTDRDDKLTFTLVPETDAPRMFGYRHRQE